MNVIYSVKEYVTNVLDFNHGTISGAIDIVAVQHEDGTVRCTPFHVHFGKLELNTKAEKQVVVSVNGKVIEGVYMKLGAAGEAFFVDSVEDPVEEDYSTSPLVSPSTSTASSSSSSYSQQYVTQMSIVKPEAANVTNNINAAPEWHDAYRLVMERPTLRRDGSGTSERLTWGWGALPIVRSSSALNEMSAVSDESHTDDALPRMVKNDSVYFDAIEDVNVPYNAYSADHPCMSLCGHLLSEASNLEEAHSIFSEHILTFELFKEKVAELLQNPDLRFLIQGKICAFTTEIQAYLVARVLFPSSQPMPLMCTWAPNRRARIASDRSDSSFWFGEEEDDQETEEEEEVPVQSRRWYQWFPKSTTTAAITVAVNLTPPQGGSRKPPTPIVHSEIQPPPYKQTRKARVTFFRKSLCPTQQDLKKMNLRYGTNEIVFTVNTLLGKETVCANFYLWPVSAKIIIAEIDGAISRIPTRRLSDLIMEKPKPGPHDGAIEFYAKAAKNGYHVVYLTGRGLSQADFIHHMLRTPTTSNGLCLPNGPVLHSPDWLLETNTDMDMTPTRNFQVTALNGLRTLFPTDVNPFYAAFGKTYNDSVIFTQVGVFPGKVFLVDEGDGRLRHRSMMNYKESYSSLLDLVDKMFPPICSPSPRHLRRGSGSNTVRSSSPLLISSPTSGASSSASQSSSLSPNKSIDQVERGTDDLLSDVISSQARTRCMEDEAYNDVNFWRIQPGTI